MNGVYTELSKQYIELKDQLKRVNKNAKRDREKKFDDPVFLEKLKITSEVIENNKTVQEEVNELETVMKNFIYNLQDCSRKINKLIVNFKVQPNHSMSEYTRDHIEKAEEGIPEKLIRSLGSIKDWNKIERETLFKFLNHFNYSLRFVYNLNLISVTHTLETNDVPNFGFTIVDLKSENVLNKIEENISKAMYNLENKYKILLRSDRELFMDRKTFIVEKKKDVMLKQTNLKHIFSAFEKNNEVHNFHVNSSIKPKLINQLQKFTNYLVVENNPTSVEQQKEVKALERQNALRQKQIEDKLKEEKMLTEKNDSYREEEKPPELIMKPPMIEINNKDFVKSDLNKLYKRVGDVNKLHMKYIIEKEDNMNNKEFNQVYFKLKKKNEHYYLSSKRKSNMSSQRNEEVNPSFQPPAIKLIAVEDISRNKIVHFDLPNLTVSNMSLSNSKISNKRGNSIANMKTNKVTRNQRILDELFDDDYLKENEAQILKFSKGTSEINFTKTSRPYFSTFKN